MFIASKEEIDIRNAYNQAKTADEAEQTKIAKNAGFKSFEQLKKAYEDTLAYNKYRKIAGEVEAWDVESRLDMTAEERKNTRPDIDRTDVVFAENSGISSFSLSSDVSESESKKIIKIINENVSKIANKTIFDVKNVDISNYKHKSDYVLKVFNEHGNQALNPEIGVVELMKSGAKSTMLHGFGKVKIAAVNAIKPVIEKGNIISFEKNYNEKGYDRYVIAGKGIIDEKPAYVGVVINTLTNNANKFYLHEAEIIEAEMHSMTALPLQVDTDSNSTSIGSISNPTEKVNNSSENSNNFKKQSRDSEGNNLTKQQSEYFKDSKVRDEDGNLLVVYHGTDAEFNTFDISLGRPDMDIQGAFFSPDKYDANGYGTVVKPYYINITKPADFDTAFSVFKKLRGEDDAGVKTREELIRLGYDGVNNGDEYIAFYPEQIKLTSNTNPTTNEDIRYQERDFAQKLKNSYGLNVDISYLKGYFRPGKQSETLR